MYSNHHTYKTALFKYGKDTKLLTLLVLMQMFHMHTRYKLMTYPLIYITYVLGTFDLPTDSNTIL